jgi:NADH-quinone oxidoreductase subunit H
MNTILPLIAILFFPSGLFLLASGLVYEFVDRKLVARYQNRIGPRWFQPLADIFKACNPACSWLYRWLRWREP